MGNFLGSLALYSSVHTGMTKVALSVIFFFLKPLRHSARDWRNPGARDGNEVRFRLCFQVFCGLVDESTSFLNRNKKLLAATWLEPDFVTIPGNWIPPIPGGMTEAALT